MPAPSQHCRTNRVKSREVNSKRLTWYEFFAGGGMARIGLGPGWTCSFANEWCEKKAASYRAFFGASELRVCDVADLRADDLPGAPALVWASFPCQDCLWRAPAPDSMENEAARFDPSGS
jgi:hypothetical protein